MMVNSAYVLDWLTDAQMPGRTLFLGVPVQVFPGEIYIWTGGKQRSLPHGMGITEGQDGTKSQRKYRFT